MIAIDNIIPKIMEDLNMQNITKEDLEREVKCRGELLLTLTGMAERWGLTRFDVHNMLKRDTTFPECFEGVVKGISRRQKVYHLDDVIEYEERKGLVKVNDIENRK